MEHDKIIQTWLDYCRKVLPEEWTVTRAESVSGKDGPRPPKPYLTLKIISGPRKLTLDDNVCFNGKSEGSRNFNLVGIRGYTLSIKSFGIDYIDALEDVSTCLDDPDLNTFLKQEADIAITNKGDVIDVSALLETGYERRGSLDIIFNSSKNKETSIGLIENVEVSGSISSNGNEDPIETSNIINKE